MTAAHDRPPLEGEELATWAALATVLEWLPAVLDAQLTRDAEVTHFEFGILYALSVAPERTLRMSVLADYSNSTLSRLSRAVARLERRSWVHRSTDPEDGRYTLATLTATGFDKVGEAFPAHAALVNRVVFDALTAAQVRQLGDISRRIASAIRSEPGWQPAPRERA